MEKQTDRNTLTDTIKRLREELDKIENVPEITEDYHKLFLYFIADQFEGLDPNNVNICEGRLDKKLDFYAAGEETFTVYQCKLPEIDILEKKNKIQMYGPDLINEAEDCLTFLTDDSGTAKGNKCSQEARNEYRVKKQLSEEDEGIYKLEVVIAYFGKLTEPAKQELNLLKKNWVTDDGRLEIKTIDYDDISALLEESLLTKDRPKEIRLPINPKNQVHTNTWAYALVPAITFCEHFKKHKMSLFDLNVRYYLEKSHVNKEIIKTLNEDQGMKNFHLLNNGVTIACKGWSFPKVKDGQQSEVLKDIILNYPQVINGCQTVISLYRAYTQMDDNHKRKYFETKCYIPVRMILTQEEDLLAEIVTASNNQNKMSTRNLRSNSRYQRLLQRKFNILSNKWFYERKDGEFASLKEHSPRWFKEKDYLSSKNIERVVSNEIIAKSWLSFIGFSTDASERINAFGFESEEENSRYKWLFEMVPDGKHWTAITQGPQVKIIDDNFLSGSPAPEQYLLSYLIYQFIKAYLPSPQANKIMCIERFKKSGVIKDDISEEERKKTLMGDDSYVLNQILYGMKEVIVELYAWIFVKRYGKIDETTAKKLLQMPGLNNLYSNPDFKSYAKAMRDENNDNSKKINILTNCFGFIEESVKRWYNTHYSEYQLHTRRARYLHFASTIERFKRFLEETDKHTREISYEWKPPKKRFLEALPDLPNIS